MPVHTSQKYNLIVIVHNRKKSLDGDLQDTYANYPEDNYWVQW